MDSGSEHDLQMRREAVLSRSPFLKAFLAEQPNWETELARNMPIVSGMILDKHTKDWTLETFNAHTHSLKEAQVFQPGLSTQTETMLTTALMLIGYEIGNSDEVALFHDNLSERLQNLGALNANDDSPEEMAARKNALFSVADAGAQLRQSDDIIPFRSLLKNN